MSRGGLTKDEKFLIALYERTIELEDPEEPVDCYVIGQTIGLHPRQVDAICTALMRTNFIKRQDKHYVYMTANGLDLARELLKSM